MSKFSLTLKVLRKSMANIKKRPETFPCDRVLSGLLLKALAYKVEEGWFESCNTPYP